DLNHSNLESIIIDQEIKIYELKNLWDSRLEASTRDWSGELRERGIDCEEFN
ncbi:hypothetical protein GIB67_028453, partial [Kingdonia uniflora]